MKKTSSRTKAGASSVGSWKISGAQGKLVAEIRPVEQSQYFLEEQGQASSIAAEPELAYGRIKPMVRYLGYSQQELAEVLEVDPSTLFRWKEDRSIGKLRSKTMYEIDHIISRGVRLFGSESHLKEWLNTTNYALGDRKPIELLKDPYGIELVENAMEAMAWGNVL